MCGNACQQASYLTASALHLLRLAPLHCRTGWYPIPAHCAGPHQLTPIFFPSPPAGQEQYWETQRSSFHFPSAANMAEAFYKTEAGQAVQGELSKPFGREGWGGLPTRQ